MDLSQFYFIPLSEESKVPILDGYSWPIDPTVEAVRNYDEVKQSEHDDWGVVGNRKGNLLIVDIDLYKMDDLTQQTIKDSDWSGLIDLIPIITTPSGGVHLYFEYDGPLPEAISHVDIKGDVGKGYGKAPLIDGYNLQNDVEPLEVDRDTLLDFPVFDKSNDRLSGEAIVPPCIKYAEREGGQEAKKFIKYCNKLKETGNYDVDDVYSLLDESRYPVGLRTRPPSWFSHDSSTKNNFMVKENGKYAVCWRHKNDLHAIHLVGIKEGIFTCEDVNEGTISDEEWSKTIDVAKDDGIEYRGERLSCEDVKELGFCPYECKREHPLQ